MYFCYWVTRVYSSWKSCSVTCGGGVQVRLSFCSTGIDADCDALDQDALTQACNTEDCRNYNLCLWFIFVFEVI